MNISEDLLMPLLSAWHRPFIFTSCSHTEILLRENKTASLSRNLCVFLNLVKYGVVIQ